MSTQTENDLAALCQAQSEELATTNQALADAHGELEDALDDYDKVKTELQECRRERDGLAELAKLQADEIIRSDANQRLWDVLAGALEEEAE